MTLRTWTSQAVSFLEVQPSICLVQITRTFTKYLDHKIQIYFPLASSNSNTHQKNKYKTAAESKLTAGAILFRSKSRGEIFSHLCKSCIIINLNQTEFIIYIHIRIELASRTLNSV